MKKQKTLIFDISNMLHRTFYGNTAEDDTTIAGLASHQALVTLQKYYRMHKPDKVVMAFDRKSWRKEFTASEECISKMPYKGNRRQGMTPKQEEKYKRFLGHIKEFEALITEHTAIITLAAPHLEADDMIAGYVQRFCTEEEIVIISTDTDYLQLMRYEDVLIMSPATDKIQELSEYDGDPLFYIFVKCIRGDSSDNVRSAFPRVRMARLKKAYTDPFEYENLMKETWSVTELEDGKEVTRNFVVGKLFQENQKLIDLSKHPEDIRELLDYSLDKCLNRERKFSMMFIMRFIGKYDLNRIRENIDTYIPLLSCT